MRRNYLRRIYYCLSTICIICCLFFFGYAFKIFENCQFDNLIIGGLIFNGCWQVLFTIFGMVGINQQKADYLNYNLIANLFSLIYDVLLILYKWNVQQNCNPNFKENIRLLDLFLRGSLFLNILSLCIILFFGYFYFVIFKKELYSYII